MAITSRGNRRTASRGSQAKQPPIQDDKILSPVDQPATDAEIASAVAGSDSLQVVSQAELLDIIRLVSEAHDPASERWALVEGGEA